jgi:hypothetical protein
MESSATSGAAPREAVAALAPSQLSLPETLPPHPRLLARPDDWSALDQRCKADPALEGLVAGIVERARARLGDDPLERRLEGRRLLSVSRELVARVLLAAFAYRRTAERAFLDRAEQDMLAVSAFADWNPSHFLDVAEMTTGLAIGYDWLYDSLSPDTRAAVRTAIVEKGLEPGSDPAKNRWYHMRNNWNQVCLGGMALGALAVYEHEPEMARQILDSVPQYKQNGLEPYRPDGVYPEGPGYWSYGTTYQMLLIEGLRTALGTDGGLLQAPGLLASADFMLHATAPSGRYYNFADGAERADISPALFLMARLRHLPRLIAQPESLLRERLKSSEGVDRFLPLIALWRPPLDALTGVPDPPLHWSGQGPNPIATWRSSWSDSDAFYFAIKGGGAAVSHGHMDGGSFLLEWGGVRWAVDLGNQSYHSLEKIGFGLWDARQEGDRWKVFRLNNFSHNTLTIEGQLHNAGGLATLLEADASGALIDLTPVFLAGQASRVLRRVRVEDGTTVVLVDELEGLRPGASVRWAMATGASVTIEGSASAVLTQAGRTLRVAFAASLDLRLESLAIEKPDGEWNVSNPGKRLLAAHGVADAQGRLRIEARMTPEAVGHAAIV